VYCLWVSPATTTSSDNSRADNPLLDGGGVRGLSTLIILRELLCKIGQQVNGRYEPMRPKDVFDVIVGTSTGGLIALMMVKLDLDVDECIDQYRRLSQQIFGKPNSIGKWTAGLVKPRYSGKLVRRFVVELTRESTQGGGGSLTMENTRGDGAVQCSVVCRELEKSWPNARKPEPVFLCSHRCRPQPTPTYKHCLMCDAACATSAAPTYFARQELLNRILVDGGFGETNNPSTAALEHYRIEKKSWSLPLDERILWVNIGTGSPQPHMSATRSKRPAWTWLIPNFLLDPYHLMNDMQKMATDSEQVVRNMKRLAKESHGYLEYSRFSADNGLHLIGLDDYEKVDDGGIEDLTNTYLRRLPIQTDLDALAVSLASEYKARRVALRKGSQLNSPIPSSPIPGSTSPSIVSPTSPCVAQAAAPMFPDDLSVQDMPALSRAVPTDEASEPPRTPRPERVQHVPAHLQEGSERFDTVVGSGGQFVEGRPRLTIRINDEHLSDH
jgi:hypothetical protein